MSENGEEWTKEDTEEYRRALLKNSRKKAKLKVTKTLDKDTQHIKIDINDKRLEQQRDRKDSETEKIKAMFESARNKLIEKLREHGTEIPESQIQDMEDLKVFGAILNDYNKRGKVESGTPSGTVPLSSQSAGEDSGFNSMGEMVEYLKEASKGKGLEAKEAKRILHDLWLRKLPMAVENRKIIAQFPSDEELARGESMKSLLNKKFRKKMKKRHEDDEN